MNILYLIPSLNNAIFPAGSDPLIAQLAVTILPYLLINVVLGIVGIIIGVSAIIKEPSRRIGVIGTVIAYFINIYTIFFLFVYIPIISGTGEPWLLAQYAGFIIFIFTIIISTLVGFVGSMLILLAHK